MKTRVKRRTKVKRTRTRTKRKICRNKYSRYKRRNMRKNIKGGWGFPSVGGKDDQKEQQLIYGGWGQSVPM